MKSPFFDCPEKFLWLGQRVRAKVDIYDLPGNTDPHWHNGTAGPVHAEPGETGTVVHVEKDFWPTVTFDKTGTSTCVTDGEVEPINMEAQRAALKEYFAGLSFGLQYPAAIRHTDMPLAFQYGITTAKAYLADVETGNAPGISLADLVWTGLKELKY